MDDETVCGQCGRRPAATSVRRASGSLELCESCHETEDRVPEAPIAAAWGLDEGPTVVEQVWPVAVNLHRFHLERVLEAGVEVPPRLQTPEDEDAGPKA